MFVFLFSILRCVLTVIFTGQPHRVRVATVLNFLRFIDGWTSRQSFIVGPQRALLCFLRKANLNMVYSWLQLDPREVISLEVYILFPPCTAMRSIKIWKHTSLWSCVCLLLWCWCNCKYQTTYYSAILLCENSLQLSFWWGKSHKCVPSWPSQAKRWIPLHHRLNIVCYLQNEVSSLLTTTESIYIQACHA